MSERETFTVEVTDVSVEETADALTYRFAPRDYKPQKGFSLVLLVVFVLYPLGLLALTVYARSKVANRPEWEDALTGVFLAQLLVWLVTGTIEYLRALRGSYRPFGIILKFTRTHLWHGVDRVCELEQVRGLRLFVYTATAPPPLDPRTETPNSPAERPSPKPEACLSLVIGEEGDTHGLFGGFDPQPLRALAEHIHRRLAAFRLDQGIMAPLDALSVIETTEDDAMKQMHTRPSRRFSGLRSGMMLVVQNRWAGIVWCATMLAGVFASGRMIGAAGISAAFLLPHSLLGLIHFYLLMFHIGGHGNQPKEERPEAK
jgi:hypothetical protein